MYILYRLPYLISWAPVMHSDRGSHNCTRTPKSSGVAKPRPEKNKTVHAIAGVVPSRPTRTQKDFSAFKIYTIIRASPACPLLANSFVPSMKSHRIFET